MKKIMMGVVFVMISIMVVSCAPPGVSPTGRAPATVVATSCDGDSVCEVAKTISTKARSSSDLILTSDTKKVTVQGDLDVSGKIIAKGIPNIVTQEDLFGFYSGAIPDSKTGNVICSDLGYSGCLAMEVMIEDRYLNSVDSSCDGPIQLQQYHSFWKECTFPASLTPQCNNDIRVDVAEPAFGDRMLLSEATAVICNS